MIPDHGWKVKPPLGSISGVRTPKSSAVPTVGPAAEAAPGNASRRHEGRLRGLGLASCLWPMQAATGEPTRGHLGPAPAGSRLPATLCPSDALEAVDRLHEDDRAADLHLEAVGHVEEARLERRGIGQGELGAAVAVPADDVEDGVDLLLRHADQDGAVAAAQEAAAAADLGGAELLGAQPGQEVLDVLVLDNRDDQLHSDH